MPFFDGSIKPTTNSAKPNVPSTSGSGSFSKFKGFGSLSGADLSTSEGLLQLAQSQGGALSEVANELVHPTTSILSTMGNAFKNTFKSFVNIISKPSQVVAGALSSKYTVREALKQNLSPSDVIWGEMSDDATTMQKIGGFLTRTATDILLDPLTYLTFGAGSGIAGLRATTKITLEEKAATKLGKEILSPAALSDEGQGMFKYLKNIEHQQNGTAKALDIANKTDTHVLAEKELKQLMDETIDAPLNFDYSKKAMSNLLEKFPQLTDTFLDKGGIKFFGNSMLSGQRIAAVKALIPGMTTLDHITAPMRNAVQSLFDPSLIKTEEGYVRIPQEAVDIIQAGQDLTRSRAISKGRELSDIVRSNKLTVDESKLVTAAIEARKLPADPRLANAVKQFLNYTDDEFNFLSESGIPIAFRDAHVPHVLLKTKVQGVGAMSFSKKAGASYERKVADTIAEAKDWGVNFDENIVTAHYARTLDNTRAGVAKQVMNSLGESMGQVKSLAPDGWVPVSMKGVEEGASKLLQIFGDKGEEIVFHPAVAKRIEKFIQAYSKDDATKGFLKAFDGIQNLWKAGVTSIFPSFHGRNAISNVLLNFLDLGAHVLDPSKHIMSVDMIAKDRQINKLQRLAYKPGAEGDIARNELHDLLERNVFTDATGYNWSYGELRQTLKDKGIAFNKDAVGAMDVSRGTEEFSKNFFPEYTAKSIAKKALPITQDFVPFEVGREVGRAIEEHGRILNFIANLKNTGDVNLAAQRTKQFLFDYGNLTDFEKNVMKRFIPFYTFTRKNLELQVKTLFSTPGRISAEFEALNNIGDAISGGQLTEEEQKALPDWIKTGINILKSKKGSTVEILGSLGTPIEQPFQAFQPNVLLGSISPLIRLPIEQMSGYSFYQGKALSDVTNASAFKRAPKVVKDFIGYTEIEGKKSDGTPFTWQVALRPERMNVVNNLPLVGRVLSSIKQMDAQDVSTQLKTWQQLIGIRPYSFDLETEAQKRENELKSKLENLLTKSGVTAQFKRTFIPKDKF